MTVLTPLCARGKHMSSLLQLLLGQRLKPNIWGRRSLLRHVNLDTAR